MGKFGKSTGRLCRTCRQYVMKFEVRGGSECIYCIPMVIDHSPSVPDSLCGRAIMNSTHVLALKEDRRWTKAKRLKENLRRREKREEVLKEMADFLRQQTEEN